MSAEVGQALAGRLARPGAEVQAGRAGLGTQGQAGAAAEAEVGAAVPHEGADGVAAFGAQGLGLEPGPAAGHDQDGGVEVAELASPDIFGPEQGEGGVPGLQGAEQEQAPEVGFVPQDGQVRSVVVHTRSA